MSRKVWALYLLILLAVNCARAQPAAVRLADEEFGVLSFADAKSSSSCETSSDG